MIFMVRNNFIFHLQCNICNPPTTISFLQSYQKLLVFMKLPFINFSIDLSQNLTPEPCLTKTLSDIIKSQLQQSLNPKVSIVKRGRETAPCRRCPPPGRRGTGWTSWEPSVWVCLAFGSHADRAKYEDLLLSLSLSFMTLFSSGFRQPGSYGGQLLLCAVLP